jgi:hypothetical protein
MFRSCPIPPCDFVIAEDHLSIIHGISRDDLATDCSYVLRVPKSRAGCPVVSEVWDRLTSR